MVLVFDMIFVDMTDIKTVLIIEDENFLSSLIKARLTKENFGVLQAFDGEEALMMLKTQKPNIIILDLILPKMSGFEVMEAISADPELSIIPVIVLSNLAQDADIEKLKKLGAREYFVKVRISTDDVIKRIKTLVP
jgi:DNA-binding response OmpR family regulator